MKKILTFTLSALCLLSVQFAADAQSASSKKPAMMLTDGTMLNTAILERTQSGDYRYAESAKADSPRLTVRKNRVKWAWIPKPDDIDKADALLNDKKYAEANAKFADALKEYGSLGWEPYCKTKQAECLSALNKEADAVSTLETLLSYKEESPYNAADLSAAYELLSKFYIKQKAYDNAMTILKKLLYADGDAAVGALIARGDLLTARSEDTGSVNDRRDAFNSYAQACLIYPSAARAAEAAFRAYQTLVNLSDARSKVFADLLKKNYPKSTYTAQLPK